VQLTLTEEEIEVLLHNQVMILTKGEHKEKKTDKHKNINSKQQLKEPLEMNKLEANPQVKILLKNMPLAQVNHGVHIIKDNN